MKRRLISLLTLALPGAIFSLPVGNPWDASLLCNGIFCEGTCCKDPCDSHTKWYDAWNLRVGFYGDYVFERHLQANEYTNHRTIHKTEIYTNAGYVALNFFDRLDIFSTLGATEMLIITGQEPLGGTGNRITVDTNTDFSWSLGARATLWEYGCLGIGAEVQYFRSRFEINFTKMENSLPDYSLNGEAVKYHEWQLGLGAAYRINIASNTTALVPYAAVKWNRALVNFGNGIFMPDLTTLTLVNFENDRAWGYAVGVTLVGCRKTGLTVEGRFADEKALHVNAQFRF
ncbi:MAG: hypothetical protein KDK55_06845 [Chlamydiia bacterium]|nr:hypothetical protein [Chlamydiia bacterium]